MIDYQVNFIQKMRFYRRRAGLTQSKLAEFCDVSNGTIGNIECGITKPSFDLIIKIAEAIKISPAELFRPEITPQHQAEYIAESQFEIVSETVNSAIHEALSTAFNNLKNYKFKFDIQ